MTASRLESLLRDGVTEVGVYDALTPDVVFHSPVLAQPVRGNDIVGLIVTNALETMADRKAVRVDELGDLTAFVFRATVDGHDLDVAAHARSDGDGRVRELKVFMRPLPAVEAFAAEMNRRLPDIQDD